MFIAGFISGVVATLAVVTVGAICLVVAVALHSWVSDEVWVRAKASS